MKIVVFGANGKVGSLVVEELLKHGHQVAAFVYGDSDYTEADSLKVISGDVRKREDVARALNGNEAVISTLGSWGTKTKDILSTGMATIIPEMEKLGIKRIISLTGSAAFVPGDKWGVSGKATHWLLGIIAPKIIYDAEEHVKLLVASKLNWTIIRSPVMNNLGRDSYDLNDKLPGMFETINRHAVARAIVESLEKDSLVHQALHIHRW